MFVIGLTGILRLVLALSAVLLLLSLDSYRHMSPFISCNVE